jgi:hypothetical protein
VKRSDDWLTQFSHYLAQFKLLLFELALLVVFLMWLWEKVRHDLNL